MERINLFFHDFEPDQDVPQKLKAQLGYMLGKGPSDASACACISKEDNKYVCNVRVHSQHGHFFVHREDERIEVLFDKVLSNLKTLFERWHEDPDKFEKDHPMEAAPCYKSNRQVFECPLHSYVNRMFENKA